MYHVSQTVPRAFVSIPEARRMEHSTGENKHRKHLMRKHELQREDYVSN